MGISGQKKYVTWERYFFGGVPFQVPQCYEISMSMKNSGPCSLHLSMCLASWWEGIAALQLLGNYLKGNSHIRIKAVAVFTSCGENLWGWVILGDSTSRGRPWQRDLCCQCCRLKQEKMWLWWPPSWLMHRGVNWKIFKAKMLLLE